MSQEQQQKVQEGSRVPGVVQASAAPATPAANNKGPVEYDVDGEKVTISRDIVIKYLTRGGGEFTESEIVMFISLCRVNKLNPFVGDAYLVKYRPKNGEYPQPAQMIISKSAFMKRAETGPGFQGFEAGVIVARGDEIIYEEGSFIPPKTTLLGGWCTVYREGRKPVNARVSISEYSTGKSTWSAKPATMIRKVAIAQAFREAYPLNLGGLYTPEEMDQAQRPDEQEQPKPEALPAPPQEAPAPTQEQAAPAPEPIPVEKPVLTHIEETGEILDENLFKV